MIAFTLILGLTPIGFIPNPFNILPLTLMCLPVIIGTVILGWKQGLILGFVFGLTSLILGFATAYAIIQSHPFAMIAGIFIPRLLIPLIAWGIYKVTAKLPKGISLSLTAAVGSLTNTVFFLGMIYILLGNDIIKQMFLSGDNVPERFLQMGPFLFLLYTAVANGIPELIVAVIICVPVMLALKKVIKE
jgi:uncharacterized membrane protein